MINKSWSKLTKRNVNVYFSFTLRFTHPRVLFVMTACSLIWATCNSSQLVTLTRGTLSYWRVSSLTKAAVYARSPGNSSFLNACGWTGTNLSCMGTTSRFLCSCSHVVMWAPYSRFLPYAHNSYAIYNSLNIFKTIHCLLVEWISKGNFKSLS